jgi:soluble lytic murein transglycosylase-like protein
LAQQSNRPGVPTERDVKTLQDIQSAEANLAIAATRAAQALELFGAPYILNGLRNMTAFFEWAARGFKDKDKFDEQVRQNDAAMHATKADPEGKGWLAELDAKRAANEEMARSPSAKLKKNASRLGFLLRGRAGPTENDPGLEPFSELDIARIKQLILQGIYPDDAVSVVKAERAAGRPSGPVGVIKIPGAPADFGALEQQRGLPAGTLAAVRQAESAGKDNAVSSAGAQGPFQMMPGTQAQYGVTDPFDVANEAPGAAANLADLIGKFHTVRKGLAAYNWGEGNLDADIKAHGDQWERFLPKDTTDYLAKLGQINPALAPGAGDVVTQTTTINGNVIVQTQATDAKGIARGLKDEIEQQRNRHAVAQSTTGLM